MQGKQVKCVKIESETECVQYNIKSFHNCRLMKMNPYHMTVPCLAPLPNCGSLAKDFSDVVVPSPN